MGNMADQVRDLARHAPAIACGGIAMYRWVDDCEFFGVAPGLLGDLGDGL
jgi:hypothetical protein